MVSVLLDLKGRDNRPSHLVLLKVKGQGCRQVDHRQDLPPDHLVGPRQQHHGKDKVHPPSRMGPEDRPSTCSDDTDNCNRHDVSMATNSYVSRDDKYNRSYCRDPIFPRIPSFIWFLYFLIQVTALFFLYVGLLWYYCNNLLLLLNVAPPCKSVFNVP